MAERIAVIGCGQFGVVLACHAQRAGHRVSLWGRNAEEVGPLVANRESSRLPGLSIPPSIAITANGRDAMDGADLILSAIPSQYARSVWEVLGRDCPSETIIVSVAKGFEMHSLMRPSEVLKDLHIGTGTGPEVITLSGPTIATEVALGLPTALVAAGEERATQRVQSALGREGWRIYCSADQIGVEAAGAIKNVIALAAGMVDGMELGMNAKATLLARGLAEMARLGIALGGRRESFFGTAGIGDLATTCFSSDGRNRTLGERIGRGQSCADALRSMASVVEGVDTCTAVVQLADRHHVDMPITRAVHGVLFAGRTPREALQELMQRTTAEERI
ncbi:MAG: NAD(P)-dependent glycerol-3-phosphate dehydrogenase [Phycisphaerales bacterium]|nr:NAD(P)-dependent glycerol-3-phosphate dehydrogenase [Phycisphaerales bacterium]